MEGPFCGCGNRAASSPGSTREGENRHRQGNQGSVPQEQARAGPLICFPGLCSSCPHCPEQPCPHHILSLPSPLAPAPCHLLLLERHPLVSPCRGVSLFPELLKLFLCLAATFSGLRLWGRAQFSSFPNAFFLHRRLLLGMADWGTRSGTAPSLLVGGGKLRPGGLGVSEGLVPSDGP